MPEQGFLQKFHDLAGPDEAFRCSTALSVRKYLAHSKGKTKDDPKDQAQANVEYSLSRLVRGVTSSRQCCRQGFSLTLAELLAEFPERLDDVLQLIRQHTLPAAGLRNSDQKDRLLGRIFAYAAILESGVLATGAAPPTSKSKKKAAAATPPVVTDVGEGLHETYGSRPYLRAPAASLLVQACRELCASGMVTAVPEALSAWDLDKKIAEKTSDGGVCDLHAAGLVMELRLVYEEVEAKGGHKAALQSWPACIRTDTYAQPTALVALARSMTAALCSSSMSDDLHYVFGAFCRWLFRVSKTRDPQVLQEHVWPCFNEKVFPTKGSTHAQSLGLRILAEIFTILRESAAGPSEDEAATRKHAELLVLGIFEQAKQGMALLFQMLNWTKGPPHKAALFAQLRITEALGAPPQPSGQPQGKRKKGGPEAAANVAGCPALQLGDDVRLQLLDKVQKHKAFGGLGGKLKRQWASALMTPLSPVGVRSSCAGLFASLCVASPDRQDMGFVRRTADQLVSFCTHTRAPDEVILAVLCLLFTASYFKRPDGASADGASALFSLREFCKEVGIKSNTDVDDIQLPVLQCVTPTRDEGNGDDEGDADATRKAVDPQEPWRTKLWAALSKLSRSTSPEMAECVGNSPDAVLRTFATHGCMSDGSLWVYRLQQWWDFIASKAPSTQRAAGRGGPKKKRRSEGADAGGLLCTANLTEQDMELRKRCMAACKVVDEEPQVEGALTKRQRNALCSLLMSLCLTLLQTEDDEEKTELHENLEEIVSMVERCPALPPEDTSAKARAKAKKQRAELLAAIPRFAAELFVRSSGLVAEATRSTWREMADVASDETIRGLCTAVRGEEEEEEGEDADGKAEDDEEDEDDEREAAGGLSGAKAARAAMFAQAVAQRKAEEAEGDGDNDDEIVLDSDEVWKKLLDDDEEGAGDGASSLLNAFASSGLEAPSGPKLTKKQQRARDRQEEMMGKFREIELVDIFLHKSGSRNPVLIEVVSDLYDSLLVAGKRAYGISQRTGEKTRANSGLKRLEADLENRLAAVVSKSAKFLSKWNVAREMCRWHSAEDWAEKLRTMFSKGASAAGPRSQAVGAILCYWFSLLHRAKILTKGKASAQEEEANSLEGWDFADELLRALLQEWSGKKVNEKWCETLFGVFAARAPQLLLRLPWHEQVRDAQSPYLQRSLLAFVSARVVRTSPPEAPGRPECILHLVGICTDLLVALPLKEAKAKASEAESSDKSSAPSSQQIKLQKEALRSAAVILRCLKAKCRGHEADNGSGGSTTADLLDASLQKRLSDRVKQIQDTATQKRSETYQLSLQVLRALRNPGPEASTAKGAKSDQSAESGGTASERKGVRRKQDGPASEGGARPRKRARSGSSA